MIFLLLLALPFLLIGYLIVLMVYMVAAVFAAICKAINSQT